jgi:uncharacterized protein YfaS (alpha-2-macroglobulin family)
MREDRSWEPQGTRKEPNLIPFARQESSFLEGPALRKAPETILWAGQLPVGADGKTQEKVVAPRAPAEWRVMARAAGLDRFGWATAEVAIGE